MRRLPACLTIALVGAASLFAQERLPPGQAGPLRLIISVDDSPGVSSGQPTATRRIKAGQTIYLAFSVSNQAADKDGRVRVQVDCRIIGPDGAPRLDRPGAAEARGPCQGTGFCTADPAISYQTGPGDPEGTYTIEAMARDLISGQRASARQAFVLSAPAAGEVEPARPASTCFSSPDEMTRWMMSYYRSPAPAKLSCALTYYADSQAGRSGMSTLPFAHFYAALIGDDPEALSRLFDQAGSGKAARLVALEVFGLSRSPRGSELMSRGCKDWSTLQVDRLCAAMSGAPRTPLLEEPLVSTPVLDSLWSRFAATGDPAFVRRIASIVHLEAEGHGFEIVMGHTAAWSLTSMARDHPKVRETLEEMARGEQGAQKAALEKILRDSGRPPG